MEPQPGRQTAPNRCHEFRRLNSTSESHHSSPFLLMLMRQQDGTLVSERSRNRIPKQPCSFPDSEQHKLPKKPTKPNLTGPRHACVANNASHLAPAVQAPKAAVKATRPRSNTGSRTSKCRRPKNLQIAETSLVCDLLRQATKLWRLRRREH